MAGGPALDHIDFSIEQGEVVGYLGPNGAGKSTTIKLLTGVLWPTSGTVEVAGPDGPIVPWRDRQRHARQVGVVFGQRTQLWWDLPLIESLRLVAALCDVPAVRYNRNLARLRDLLDLDPFLHTPVRQLSLGQRMRGDLAAALLYDPPLLYLDEPTVGLDVLAKEAVRGFVEEANRSGRTTVLLTTHDLADVERLCQRILLIDHGRVLYDGPVGGLIFGAAAQRLLTFAVPVAFIAFLPASVVLGRTDQLAVPAALGYVTPAVGGLLFALAYRFWRRQLRHYQGVGH